MLCLKPNAENVDEKNFRNLMVLLSEHNMVIQHKDNKNILYIFSVRDHGRNW